MSVELTNTLPTIMLGLMIALTLVLLPRLNDDATRRRDEPPPPEPPENAERKMQNAE
jgi:hypothetical protein